MIRENKVIKDLGVCQPSLQSPLCTVIRFSPSRVTKDRLGLQAPQALQAPGGHPVTQGRMVLEDCQVYPVNQGNQENKA